MIKMEFGFTDVTAKRDSTPSTADAQPWIDLAQLKQDEITTPPYGTLEKDYFKLDGSMVLFPDEPKAEDFGWWSKTLSNENGDFPAPLEMDIAFTENHSSIGITVEFEECGNNYADFTVRWFAGDTLLAQKIVQPTDWQCPVSQTVENYDRIVLTFTHTNHPYRYLKIKRLLYGIVRIFKEHELITANCLEEIDPLSATVSINTLDFRLHSTEAEFSIVNPQGVYRFLQQRQPITVYDETQNYGTFYLDEWVAGSENIYDMTAIDAIGVMDSTDFMGGIYANKLSGELIAEIMNGAYMQYELAPELSGIPLTGYLPICTHREALQQVAFALGAVVDCSRSDLVKIYVLDASSTDTIGSDRKFENGKITLRTYVTGVEVSEHNYLKSDEQTELYNGELRAGEHTITFSEPAYGLAATGAAIKASGANYAVLTVTETTKVVLSGKRYTDTVRTVGCYMQSIPAGQAQNILKVDSATLVSAYNSAAVAQRVFDYYQRRIEQSFDKVLESERVGQTVGVMTVYGEEKPGVIESIDSDLIAGTAKAVVVGG